MHDHCQSDDLGLHSRPQVHLKLDYFLNSPYLRQYLSYCIQTWHDGRLMACTTLTLKMFVRLDLGILCVVLFRLKKVVGVGSVEDILQDYVVNGGHVRHNCIFLNKSGIVTNIQLEGQFRSPADTSWSFVVSIFKM